MQLVGAVDHPDFRTAIELIRAGSRPVRAGEVPPELVVVAQSRPGTVGDRELESLRRVAPLAGIVALLGSWCEGETRTGRPWPGVQRLYWYEFPAWWQRQMVLRAAGRCPDWARPGNSELSSCEPGSPRARHGLIILRTPHRDAAHALSDVFNQAGYCTAWQPPGRPRPFIRGAVAGVWDGAQLDVREAADLAMFCAKWLTTPRP